MRFHAHSTRPFSIALGSVAMATLIAGCGETGPSEADRQRAAVDAYNHHGEPAGPTASSSAPTPIQTAALNPPAAVPDETLAAPSEPPAQAATPTRQAQQTQQATQAAPAASSAPTSAAAPTPRPAPAGGLPPGAGRDTVQRVCTSCHAIGMVTAKGRTPDGWSEIIGRMMGLGLEASDEDLQTVHAYLSRNLPPR
nr:cytochrome c [uncultured Brevundimonas sp.]